MVVDVDTVFINFNMFFWIVFLFWYLGVFKVKVCNIGSLSMITVIASKTPTV